MNYQVVSKNLGRICMLIGITMIFSMPWALPAVSGTPKFETAGFLGLLGSIVCSFVTGGLLLYFGRATESPLYRKEAMAIVGLSWVLATLLGALPFIFSHTHRGVGVPMTVIDCLFESQSGFSTTGATVITRLESPELVPRSILFWRSSTHFLGGLGIIVLFVAILGQGSAGKAMMRAEMPGPSKEGSQQRMQHTALWFAGIYCVLTAVLTVILWFENMSWFDALCHAFGTLATGGFSTYDKSLGYFATQPDLYNGALIEMTVLVFMIIAGTNFTLLYFLVLRQPKRMFGDTEFRTYAAILAGLTVLIMGFGLLHGDFYYDPPDSPSTEKADDIREATADAIAPRDDIRKDPRPWSERIAQAFRYSAFQVASVLTTTGFGTHDFDRWSSFSRGSLFLIMFVGGCAGSTGGGLKVIRHVLFLKILKLEIEHAYHPKVVRTLRLGGEALEDQDLRKNVLVYFSLVLVTFVVSWMFLVALEPETHWENDVSDSSHKLIDCASGVAATLNNIGPGLGTLGPTSNYAHFSGQGKLLFTLLMMMGRLEMFPIIVLLVPNFWRSH